MNPCYFEKIIESVWRLVGGVVEDEEGEEDMINEFINGPSGILSSLMRDFYSVEGDGEIHEVDVVEAWRTGV